MNNANEHPADIADTRSALSTVDMTVAEQPKARVAILKFADRSVDAKQGK